MVDRRIMILAVVVIVAVVAIAAYAMNNDKGNGDDTPVVESRNYDLDVGDTMEYLVFGLYTDGSGTVLDGTATVTLTDLNATQHKMKTEFSVDSVATDGTRTHMDLPTSEEWSDNDNEGYTKYSDETVNTFWGEETLEYYINDDMTDWVLVKGDVTFAKGTTISGAQMYLELKDCSAFTQKKVEREIHEAVLEQNGSIDYGDGNVTEVKKVYVYSNPETEIFKQVDCTVTLTEDGESQVQKSKAWQFVPEDYYGLLGETIQYVHTTEKIDTVWGEMEVDAYTFESIGTSATDYIYGNILIKTVTNSFGIDVILELVSVELDGKDVAPKDITFFV